MDKRPWYREPWPWLLMAGPATVMVAGTFTSLVAFKGADGLVADDYYKQGLAINRVIARDALARELGIRGRIQVDDGTIRASLAANRPLEESIRLRLVAARAGADCLAMLRRDASGLYVGSLGTLPARRWTVVLETPQWRLEAPADLRHRQVIDVGAAQR